MARLLCLVVAALLAPATLGAADRPPNIVLIAADDLGYGELGCQGNSQIPTPHIDSIAAAGVRCTAGYVTASYCSPSRAGLLTGKYQTRFGHEHNPTGKHNLTPTSGLPLSEKTLADILRQAGYATGLAGKWHLGGAPAYHPQRRGFDEFYGFLHEGHFYKPPPYDGLTSFLRVRELPPEFSRRRRVGSVIYSTHMGHGEPPYDEHNPILRGGSKVDEARYLTDAITGEAVSFIDAHADEPFFLYAAYGAVHSPMQAPTRRVDAFGRLDDIHRQVFAGMLAELDDGVGRILNSLRDRGLLNDTLVFFISDNGGPTKELTSSNSPLRGGKGSLYEGGIRVPFLLQWNGKLPSGKVYDPPVMSTDLFVTACAEAGVTSQPADGVNLIPYLTGGDQRSPHETLYWRMGRKAALRHGGWKIVRHSSGSSDWELYDLANDLSETTDLAEQETDTLNSLVRRWAGLDAEMVAPAWSR